MLQCVTWGAEKKLQRSTFFNHRLPYVVPVYVSFVVLLYIGGACMYINVVLLYLGGACMYINVVLLYLGGACMYINVVLLYLGGACMYINVVLLFLGGACMYINVVLLFLGGAYMCQCIMSQCGAVSRWCSAAWT